jgi:hypothetical protein
MTGRSPEKPRDYSGCVGYAALGLIVLVVLAVLAAVAALLDRAF